MAKFPIAMLLFVFGTMRWTDSQAAELCIDISQQVQAAMQRPGKFLVS